jgi:methanethiol S-methyltransferase
MHPDVTMLVILAAAWVGYFALHSWFASVFVKQRLEHAVGRPIASFRLMYNGIAALTLVGPLAALVRARSSVVLPTPPAIQLTLDIIALLCVAAFLATLHNYRLRNFLGAACGTSAMDDGGKLNVSGLNRFVRHPWYFLGLIIVWTRPMDPAWMVTTAVVTLYLLVGTWLEERKLVIAFGSAYQTYQQSVPALCPWPGRFLSPARAKELEG